MGYYREDNWVQCKFEDQDHRVAKTRLKSRKSDFLSDFLKYGAEFEDKFVEEYHVGQCRFDYFAAVHGVRMRSLG